MTTNMTVTRLARYGASAALVLALAMTAACGGPKPANTTNAATNTAGGGGLGLGAFNGTGGGKCGMNGGNGGMGGGNGGGGMGGGDSGNMQALSSQFDNATYNSCVPAAMRNGAAPQVAQQYCQCVVNQLDRLPIQQKLNLTPQSPELSQAANLCQPSNE
jgi:hypothetical protein